MALSSICIASGESVKGTCYAFSCTQLADAAALSMYLFHDRTKKDICVYQYEQTEFSDQLGSRIGAVFEQFLQGGKNNFFWNRLGSGRKRRNLATLLSELRRLYPREGSRLFVCVSWSASEEFTALPPTKQRKVLAAFSEWAASQGIQLHLVFLGSAIYLGGAALAASKLSGLAKFSAISAASYELTVDFWLAAESIFAREWLLALSEDQTWQVEEVRAHKGEAVEQRKRVNKTRIFASRMVLGDAGASAANIFARVAESNAELVEIASKGVDIAAFGCDSNTDFLNLAEQIHSLRKVAEPGLRIMVREMRPYLRHTDEQFLLRAGADLVVPAALSFSTFLGQLSALSKLYSTRDTVSDFTLLRETWRPPLQSGYTDPEQFIDHVRNEFERATYTDVEHALVVLRPAEGIRVKDCLSLCGLFREGDQVTASSKGVYLFFYACRGGDVDIALRHSFSLPADQLFSHRDVIVIQDGLSSIFREIRSYADLEEFSSLASDHQGNLKGSLAGQSDNLLSMDAILAKPLILESSEK
ncbi:hypothetical protein IB286_01600 [Spongiibacter sp. KMU-158]|uniref:Cellulose biosynthesis protein BcsE n=1 Tax=Spongiibacter pelagi TaxID=2760804 RepID=A0A927BY38_9GAMM|nr:BcsE family c-di-GMP-binding protein [Spongiibacter pelagi]MBD2857683.1 hypothetical protein [Spongiibacter pelagi]